jgi:outer membrane protein
MRFHRAFLNLLMTVSVWAAGTGTAFAETLTWRDCVEEASRANPSLQSSREGVSSAHFQTKSAYGNYFPQISGNVNASDGAISSNVPGTLTPSGSGVSSGGANAFFSTSIQASQNVFAGFADKAKIGQGKANEGIARAGFDVARSKASFDLKSAFAGLQYAQEEMKLANEIIRRRKDNKDMVELRFESGGENKGSLLLSEANLKDAQFGTLQAKNDIEVGRQQLAQVLGRDTSSDLRITGLVPLKSPPPTPNLDALMRETPQYRQAVSQKQFTKQSIVAARSPFFPNLNLTAAAGRQGDTFFPEGNRWTVGGNLSIPFFNGGRDFYNLKSAKATDAAAAYNLESTETQVRSDLAQAYANYLESIERLTTDQSFLTAASIRAEIARSEYSNGLMTFQDWDVIENDLIGRQKNFLLSQKNRVVAEAAWEQAQGKGVIP